MSQTSLSTHPSIVSPIESHGSDNKRSVFLRRLLQVSLLVIAVVFLAADFAEAKRFGGGRSFGSRKSYTNNYSKQTSPDRNTASDQRQATPGQQGNLSKRGGFGGMIGGLLMGSLLGSLLFGGGFGGVGMFDLLLLGLVGFLIFKVMRSRRMAAEAAGAGGDRFAYARAAGGPAPNHGRDSWEALRSTPAAQPRVAEPSGPAMPDGVDEAEFLDGAKALYARLQASWDRRDLDDIRTFTSPEVFTEIARQAQEDPEPGKTEILMIEARVLESRTEGSETVIAVLYDALLREDITAAQPSQVREVWHIHRDNAAPRPEWTLEGIQQLDI